MPILVVGLGNELMSDDGVGVHAVRALQGDPAFDAPLHEVGTAVLDALPLLESAQIVVAIDAVHGAGPPGTIYRFEPDVPRQCLASAAGMSLHELNLPAAMRLLPLSHRPRLIVLGVEPYVVAPGVELSEVVRSVFPRLLDEVRKHIVELRSAL